MKRLKLEIEPIPSSTWGITLANKLDRKDWDDIRHQCYREANYECSICGPTNSKLHCHELWKFDDRKRIQKLVGVECRCVLCHDVNHFGRSSLVYPKDYVNKLISHWCAVNGKTKADFEEHLAKTRRTNRRRASGYYIVKVGRRTLV